MGEARAVGVDVSFTGSRRSAILPPMRRPLALAGPFVALLLAVALSSSACFKKKQPDPIADAPDTADAAASADKPARVVPDAVNAKEIARFGDEIALEPEDGKVEAFAIANKGPASPEHVAPLKRGAQVTKIAKRAEFVLVTFQNPRVASERLAGWIPASSFSAIQGVASSQAAAGAAPAAVARPAAVAAAPASGA